MVIIILLLLLLLLLLYRLLFLLLLTGVRNFEARKTMKAMLVGDLALMYHSNAKKQTGNNSF